METLNLLVTLMHIVARSAIILRFLIIICNQILNSHSYQYIVYVIIILYYMYRFYSGIFRHPLKSAIIRRQVRPNLFQVVENIIMISSFALSHFCDVNDVECQHQPTSNMENSCSHVVYIPAETTSRCWITEGRPERRKKNWEIYIYKRYTIIIIAIMDVIFEKRTTETRWLMKMPNLITADYFSNLSSSMRKWQNRWTRSRAYTNWCQRKMEGPIEI